MDQLTVATHDQKLQLWISRIQECRASGITVEAWCKQQGFSSKNYYYWMRKIKREAFEALPAERKPTAKMQSVVYETPFAEIPIGTVPENTTAVCCIRLGNAVLEVNSGADSVTIENVLRAIKNLC